MWRRLTHTVDHEMVRVQEVPAVRRILSDVIAGRSDMANQPHQHTV